MYMCIYIYLYRERDIYRYIYTHVYTFYTYIYIYVHVLIHVLIYSFVYLFVYFVIYLQICMCLCVCLFRYSFLVSSLQCPSSCQCQSQSETHGKHTSRRQCVEAILVGHSPDADLRRIVTATEGQCFSISHLGEGHATDVHGACCGTGMGMWCNAWRLHSLLRCISRHIVLYITVCTVTDLTCRLLGQRLRCLALRLCLGCPLCNFFPGMYL